MNIQTLNDPAGKTSSARIVYVVGPIIFMVTWAVISIMAGAMVTIDPVWLGFFGMAAAQKTTQSFAEQGRK